jgi:hypothetical protein
MTTNNSTDTARLSLLLNELRLQAIKLLWPSVIAAGMEPRV